MKLTKVIEVDEGQGLLEVDEGQGLLEVDEGQGLHEVDEGQPSITFENANRAKPVYVHCHVSNLPPIYPW